ncbi:MAG: LysM peptidoglycan-binding domain-containing protein [Burkholderiales bacterium]|nr:LysM peptidoglycan-binding domain-containing protein [Burkholderiales bacterium]
MRVPTVDRTLRHDDLWQRIRDGFAMPDLDGPLVREKDRLVPRAAGLPAPACSSAVACTSTTSSRRSSAAACRPSSALSCPWSKARSTRWRNSRAHASGLWQFIPGTGKRYDLKQNWWYDARRDIVDSTAAALEYLKALYDMHGDWHLALASYNWGENAVARAIEKNRAAGLPLDYSSLAMPLETRHYVPKLQALKAIVATPEVFGIALDPIPNRPYFTTITKTRDIDVRLAARLAEMPVEEFIALNPGFNRPVIPVRENPRIVLPADRVEVFRANLQKYDEKALVSWRTYHPKRGETLEAIARRFGIGVAQLKEVNGIGARSRSLPPLLVVPTNGAASHARLPIMYAPPIPVAPSARATTHRVQPGETLATIAARYRVSVEDLRRWNQIGRLQPGQVLRIHAPAALPDAAAVRKPAAGKPKPKTKANRKKPRTSSR